MNKFVALPTLRARNFARIAAACAGAVMILALFDLREEYQVWQAQQLLDRQRAAIVQGAPRPAMPNFAAGEMPPRAEVTNALVLAQAAATNRVSPDRDRRLADAQAMIASAMTARPDWAEAQLVSSYIGLVRNDGHADQRVLRDFAASYRSAVFLRDAAKWRSTTGFILWPMLNDGTRTHVVDEAVLIARLSPDERPAIFAAARASPAYLDFGRVWTLMRRGDMDKMPGNRPAP
ncbi:hypothetical protein [Novosphingobium sp.]|uniref:hypothetical protein n=1 Tax=Novosphingobium sp. TaxID=1874826 RepID=UPI003D0E6931